MAEIKTENHSGVRVVLIIAVAVVLIATMIAGTYYFLSLKSGEGNKKETSAPVAESGNLPETISPVADATLARDAYDMTNSFFEKAINSDFENGGSYLDESVYYVVESADCCGALTPLDAQQRLIQDTKSFIPFDFTEKDPMIKKVREGVPDLDEYKIGIAPHYDDGYIFFAYHLNASGKIDKIYIAHSNQLDIKQESKN